MKFINDYGLPYTSRELMDIIGEQCAVSNVEEVRTCLKCYFISPLGLSNNQDWELADDFDIIADWESLPGGNFKFDCEE